MDIITRAANGAASEDAEGTVLRTAGGGQGAVILTAAAGLGEDPAPSEGGGAHAGRIGDWVYHVPASSGKPGVGTPSRLLLLCQTTLTLLICHLEVLIQGARASG